MKIATKTAVGFASLLALMLCMTVLAFWHLSDITSRMDQLLRDDAAEERVVWDWYAETKANAVRALVLTRSEDADIQRLLTPALEATSKRISELQKQVEGMLSTDEARALFAEIGDKRKAYIAARTAALAARKAGNAEESRRLVDSNMVPAIDNYIGVLNKMVEYQKRTLESEGANVVATAARARTTQVTAALLALLLGLILVYWLRRAILRPLNEAVRVAQVVASGDLTSTIEAKTTDEAGQLMRALAAMNHNLADIVREARNATGGIALSSREIAASNSHLSSRTEVLVANLEETATSMEQLTATVKQNAERAREAAGLASGASDIAQKGGLMAGEAVRNMADISESAKKIADIIGVIDSIAFQTNILALNAAVEAARAGEQGRGFAVVAAEVRSLAQRSAQAAKEIKALIGESVGKVESGARVVGDAGKTMQEIVAAAQRVSEIIVQIADASREQSAGIDQVNQAITQMDHSTQQSAAQVEQAAATAQQMSDQADVLSKVVARFKVIDRRAGPRTNDRAVVSPPAQPVAVPAVAAAAAGPEAKPVAIAPVRSPQLATPPRTSKSDGEWKEF